MNTYDWADISLYENFRLYLVSKGYLPDKNAMTATEYAEQVALLGEDYIPIFSVSNQLAKAERPNKGIFLHRFAEREGNVGAGTGVSYLQERIISPTETVYDRYLYPEKTTDFIYAITLIAPSRKFDSILSSIVANVLGKRKYIPTYNETMSNMTGPMVYMDYVVQFDRSSVLGFDRRIDYRMKDLWVEDHILIEEGIPKLTTVTAELKDNTEESVSDVTID